MSEQTNPDRPSDPLGKLAPPPGAFETAPTDVFDLAEPGSVAGRATRSPGRFAVLGLGALMFAGGTAFALTSAGGGGPQTPEEAVSAMFEAVANEDALGVLGALDPAERDAIREPMQQMVRELERLEVLDESFDLGGVSGLDIEFDGLQFEVEQVRPDLARVQLTAGEASVAVNGDEIAVGDFVNDVLDEFDADLGELSASESSEFDPADAGGFFVARNTDDGWRISLGYTAAEAARDAFGGAVPAAGSGIVPRGADSPEQAVERMLRSAADFDFEDVIAGLSSEMHPLREYSEFYEDELRDAEIEAASEVRVEVGDIQLEANESASTALVTVRGFDLSIEVDGSRYDIEVDGDCVTIGGDLDDLGLGDTPFESGRVCADDIDELSRNGLGELERELAEEGIELPEFGPLNEVEVGIVAVREDGAWFVSPVRTAMDLGVKGLQAINREHLDAGVDFAQSLIESFESSFSTSFDDEFSTTFEDDFTTTFDEQGGSFDDEPFIDVATEPDDGVEPGTGPNEQPEFDEEFEFELPETFEEQVEFIFGDDAPCIITEVDLLEASLRDGVRAGLMNDGVLSLEAGDALSTILDGCGAFES